MMICQDQELVFVNQNYTGSTVFAILIHFDWQVNCLSFIMSIRNSNQN